MENEHHLKKALEKLPGYEPGDVVWQEIEGKLSEQSLQDAIGKLQEYEPDDEIWYAIEAKNTEVNHRSFRWWSVAAVIALVCGAGLWFSEESGTVTYSKDVLDPRLLASHVDATDAEYEKLREYCEAETTVCKSEDFKELKAEYETLDTAATHLLQAIGKYNTDPELVRQLDMLEQGKADILTQMAKMI